MKDINIVLHEPEIPQNTGNIARTCAATGAALHIIKPMGFEIDDRKLKRAGLDYWHLLDITYYENLEESGVRFLSFLDKSAAMLYRCRIQNSRIPLLRQGDKRTARGFSPREY